MLENYVAVGGRVLDTSKPVQVYRNLNNGKLSVRQQGLVYGHCTAIRLKGCRFVVSEPGRQRVLRQQRKNVHAYIEGYVDEGKDKAELSKKLNYNPYLFGYFYIADTEEAVYKADVIEVHSNGTMLTSLEALGLVLYA